MAFYRLAPRLESGEGLHNDMIFNSGYAGFDFIKIRVIQEGIKSYSAPDFMKCIRLAAIPIGRLSRAFKMLSRAI
jgi:hypothetical protein